MYRLLLILLISSVSMLQLMAQQTLFNVPSAAVTERKHVFFQKQVNFYSDNVSFSLTSSYGLGLGWEIGVNCYDATISTDYRSKARLYINNTSYSAPDAPLVLLTCLKVVQLTDKNRIGFGLQFGSNPFRKQFYTVNGKFAPAYFTYVIATQEFEFRNNSSLELYGGIYLGNRPYFGQSTHTVRFSDVINLSNQDDHLGLLSGYEYKIIPQKLHLMGEWIFGNNTICNVIPGIVYYPKKRVSLSLGWLIPSPKTGNPQGVVFELTLF